MNKMVEANINIEKEKATKNKITEQKHLNNEAWNLSWYECCIAFEDKVRNRSPSFQKLTPEIKAADEDTPSEENTSADSRKVVVPVDVVKQLEVVRIQLTEYHTIMEKLQKIKRSNKRLTGQVTSMEKAENAFKSKIAQKEEQIDSLNAQMVQEKNEVERLSKKLAARKKNREIRKRIMEKELNELNELRELHGETAKNLRLSADPSITPKSIFDTLAEAVRGTGVDDYDDDILDDSMGSGDSAPRKGNMLKSLLKNLSLEDTYKIDEEREVATRNYSITSSASFRLHKIRQNSGTNFFSSFLSSQEDDGDDNATI